MRDLEEKEKDLNKLKVKADGLLNNNHPAADKIDVRCFMGVFLLLFLLPQTRLAIYLSFALTTSCAPAGLHGHLADPVELAPPDHQVHRRPPEGQRGLQPGKRPADSGDPCVLPNLDGNLFFFFLPHTFQFFKEANDTYAKLQKEHEAIRNKFSCDKNTPLENLMELLRNLEVSLRSRSNRLGSNHFLNVWRTGSASFKNVLSKRQGGALLDVRIHAASLQCVHS